MSRLRFVWSSVERPVQVNAKSLCSVAVLLLVGLSLWWSSSGLLDWGLQRLMALNGLSQPKVSGFGLGLEQADLALIEFCVETEKGGLRVQLQGVTATYDLLSASLGDIHIDRASLKFSYRPSGLAQASSDELLFPLRRMNIEQLELEVETPWGASHFTGQVDIRRPADRMLVATLQDLRHSLHIELDSALGTMKAALRQTASGEIVAELQGKQLDQIKQQVSLDANVSPLVDWLTASQWLPTRFQAKMAASASPLFTPATVSMRLNLSAELQDRFDNIQSRMLLTKDNAYLASAQLNVRPGKANLDSHLDMAAPEVFELAKPWLPACNVCRLTTGRVAGSLKLAWRESSSSMQSIRLKAYGVGLATESVRFEDIYLELEGEDIAGKPLAIALDVPKLAFGEKTTLGNLVVKARYFDRRLTVDRATLPAFGGVIEVSPDTVDIAQRPIELTLEVRNADLSQLLNTLDYPALTGSGVLSGKLPLSLDADTVAIVGGNLESTRSGVLSYSGPVADKENIAFKALRNLVYHRLRAELNYRPTGDYHLGLRLEGSNPEVLSGHPLAFNLNLDGQLPELLRKGMLTGNFEQPILEQATKGRESARDHR